MAKKAKVAKATNSRASINRGKKALKSPSGGKARAAARGKQRAV